MIIHNIFSSSCRCSVLYDYPLLPGVFGVPLHQRLQAPHQLLTSILKGYNNDIVFSSEQYVCFNSLYVDAEAVSWLLLV